MKKLPLAIVVASALLPTHSMAASSITEAFQESKPVLDLRLRYESNDTDGGDEKGDAVTLKTVIGIKTGEYEGFSAYADMINVSADDDDYKFSGASNIPTDLVPDPEGDELNQAYLQYKADGHLVKFGRQRLIYDNARFIGNVGWRQNEQTFEGLSYKNTSIEDVTVNAAYLTSRQNVFFANSDQENYLLNVKLDNLGPGALTPYVYILEGDLFNGPAGKEELSTYGASYAGKVGDDMPVSYRFEFATQTRETEAGVENDADYINVELGTKIESVGLKLGYELLGSDEGNYGFSTPLATLHKFNGWADKFLLSTPDEGLEDIYFSATTKVAGVKLLAVYHDYSADEGGDDLGSEVNLLAAKKFNKHYSVGAKYASFSAPDGGNDTEKVWVWTQAKF